MAQVRVFKNLNRPGFWSVQMRTEGAWRTVAHARGVVVSGATFYASEAARLRCAAAHKREVHAWTQGELVACVDARPVDKWSTPDIVAALSRASVAAISPLPVSVSYRPFERSDFRVRSTLAIVRAAPRAAFTFPHGCTVD